MLPSGPPAKPPLGEPALVTILEIVKLSFLVPAVYVPPAYKPSVTVPVELPPE